MSDVPNPFDACGLVKVQRPATAQTLTDLFDAHFQVNEHASLAPYQIYLSKAFLQKLLRDMRKKPGKDLSRNCVRLRLGLQRQPTDASHTPVSWMIQPLYANQELDGTRSYQDEGNWYVSDMPSGNSGEGIPTEPVVMKDPAN